MPIDGTACAGEHQTAQAAGAGTSVAAAGGMGTTSYGALENLGGLIAGLYDAYLREYEDEELAMLATATVVNETLLEEDPACEPLAA